jgi:hypothetical protein
MADVRMALAQLLEKASDADLLREMVGYLAPRLMELDVHGLCAATRRERSVEREKLGQRLPRSRMCQAIRQFRAIRRQLPLRTSRRPSIRQGRC